MKKFISAGHIGGASAAANHRDAIIRNTFLPDSIGKSIDWRSRLIFYTKMDLFQIDTLVFLQR